MGDVIRESFARVKKDFEEQDSRISELRKELEELRRQVVDYMPKLLEQNTAILRRLESLEQRVAAPGDPLKQQLLKRYKRGRRELVKQKMLELVATREMGVAGLRDTIVHELGYCSRASFYRYLEELQRQGVVAIASVNGLQRVRILSQISSQ